MTSTAGRVRLFALALVLGLGAATMGACGGDDAGPAAGADTGSPEVTITVLHPAVPAPTMVLRAEGVSSVGDVRLWNFDGVTEDGEAVTMDWVMTTTAVDVPSAGLETRFATGVFSFADGEGAYGDQLILEGVATYPAAGSVLETSRSTERAIVGGTGRFAGARGSVVSTHLDDDTWRHVFTLR